MVERFLEGLRQRRFDRYGDLLEDTERTIGILSQSIRDDVRILRTLEQVKRECNSDFTQHRNEENNTRKRKRDTEPSDQQEIPKEYTYCRDCERNIYRCRYCGEFYEYIRR